MLLPERALYLPVGYGGAWISCGLLWGVLVLRKRIYGKNMLLPEVFCNGVWFSQVWDWKSLRQSSKCWQVVPQSGQTWKSICNVVIIQAQIKCLQTNSHANPVPLSRWCCKYCPLRGRSHYGIAPLCLLKNLLCNFHWIRYCLSNAMLNQLDHPAVPF